MSNESTPPEELKLVSEKMIGIVLLKAKIDSNGAAIVPNGFYRVQKHVKTKKLVIFPVAGSLMDKDFIDSILNYKLQSTGELN